MKENKEENRSEKQDNNKEDANKEENEIKNDDKNASEKISVVIPVYQNEKMVEKVIRDIYENVIDKYPGSELIVAEDGSTDQTKPILKRLVEELKFNLISGEERKGYTGAIKNALKLPKTDLILFMDSDGEHTAKDFSKLIDTMKKEDADLVVGYKLNRKPFYRYLISKCNNYLLYKLYGLKLRDANCGFRLIKKKVIDDCIDSIGTLKAAINAEFSIRAFRKGYIVREVGVSHKAIPSQVFSPWSLPKTIWKELGRLKKLKKELDGN